MGFAAIICFVIAAIAIEQGEVFMIVFFGGLGLWLTYLWATKEERRTKELFRIRQQTIEKARARFTCIPLANKAAGECKGRDEYCCDVCFEYIKTPVATHHYSDYGLQHLDEEGCELLAYYIGWCVGIDSFSVMKETKNVGGVTNTYSGHIDASGNISIVPDCSDAEVVLGYSVYAKKETPTKSEPTNKKAW